MDVLTVILSAAAVLAAAISAFIASAALAGIKKAQAEQKREAELQKQASDRLMLAQQQRREELAGLEARINKSIADSAQTGRQEQSEAIARLRAEMTDAAQRTRGELAQSADKTREELTRAVNRIREELTQSLALSRKELSDTLGEFGQNQKNELKEVGAALESIRRTVDEKLLAVQQSMENSINNMTSGNEKKLELIRETVDEKLSGTLNKRFSESFSMINDQLKNVSKGLGEMTALATNVGDLKRVLTNVKTRGTWGEMQLGALLEQVLSPAQFVHNAHVRPRSQEVVEYAIVLPGKQDGESVFLPIDSKFPMESYQRYCQASEAGNESDVRSQRAALIAEIRTNARTIQNKYIVPPYTTDFAIMYLPTEGLYAIASGDAELLSQLQREYRVTVMGPATLGAFLNSLHMGFRTLAIQKHTSRLWKDVQKTSKEFEKFGGLLEKPQKKITEAGETLSDAIGRTRTIRDRLKNAERYSPEGELEQERQSVLTDTGAYDGSEAEGLARDEGDNA